MAAGLAIVATNVGGIPDALNQYPKKILVYPSTRSILHGIIKALEIIDKSISEKAQDMTIRQYNWENIVSKIARLYVLLANQIN